VGDTDLLSFAANALTVNGTIGSDTITISANNDLLLSGTGHVTSGSEGFIVGTLTITDGSIDDTDGSIAFGDTNFTGVGNIGGTDIDIEAGTGDYTSSGNITLSGSGKVTSGTGGFLVDALALTADTITNDAAINIKPSGDADDFLVLSTVANVVQIGVDDDIDLLQLASGALTVNGTIDATGNITTTGLINGVELGKAATDNYWFGDAETMGTAGSTLSGATDNIAIGSDAGEAMTSGDDNILIGTNAGTSITQGRGNVGIGDEALASVTVGRANVGIGDNVLTVVTLGSSNIAIGETCGTGLTSGEFNIIMGASSGNGSGGSRNIIIGQQTGDRISGGDDNIVMGLMTGDSITFGDDNIFIGADSGDLVSTGDGNIFIGNFAGGEQPAETSNKFIIDNQDRFDEAADLAGGILVGSMNATPANQTLTINAALTVSNTIGSGAITATGTSLFDSDISIASGSITSASGTIDFGNEDLTTSGSIISTGGAQTGKFLTGGAGNTVFAFSGGNFDIRAGDGMQSSQNVLRVTSVGDFDFKAGNLITTGKINFRDTDIFIGSTLTDGILDMGADVAIDMFFDNADVG
ncbi:hypothetical protein LCGC14_2288000, partial [marine sediment metagenome]